MQSTVHMVKESDPSMVLAGWSTLHRDIPFGADTGQNLTARKLPRDSSFMCDTRKIEKIKETAAGHYRELKQCYAMDI